MKRMRSAICSLLLLFANLSFAECDEMAGIDGKVLEALRDHLENRYGLVAKDVAITSCQVSGGMTSINGYRIFEIAPHRIDGDFSYYRTVRCELSYKKMPSCHSFENRAVQYHKQHIRASKHGKIYEMITALDCVSGKLLAGTLVGREWSYRKRGLVLTKIPKHKRLSYVGPTSTFKEYEVIVGENEFSFIVDVSKSNACSMKFGSIIEV